MSKQKIKRGLYWHLHHGVLLEYCHNEAGRRLYIDTHKPESERALRNLLFKPVKGKLPKEVVETAKAYEKAYEKRVEAYKKAYEAKEKAYEAKEKAYKANISVIEALHKQECKNCPWDGYTIFPKETKDETV